MRAASKKYIHGNTKSISLHSSVNQFKPLCFVPIVLILIIISYYFTSYFC